MMELQLAKSAINIEKPTAFSTFCDDLYRLVKQANIDQYDNIVIACIGTDRYMADCLGPLVGHKLKLNAKDKNVYIFGTLEDPMHAQSIHSKMKEIAEIPNAFVIGVDACVCREENLHCIILNNHPLSPGSGVGKKLPEVGQISITGGLTSMNENDEDGLIGFFYSHQVRLNTVMQMANVIEKGLRYVLWKINQGPKLQEEAQECLC